MTAGEIALVVSLACQTAVSQGTPSLPSQAPGNSSSLEERKLLLNKSLGLFEEALSDRQHLKLAENRIRLAAIAAGSVWATDPERGRALFQEAKQELILLIDRIDL